MHSHSSQITMLDLVADAHALWLCDELADAWRSAQDEAVAAYDVWRQSPGRIAYTVYRAAQDRANQAQDVLAAAAANTLALPGRLADIAQPRR